MKFLKGTGIIVGLMFGAGVFALPYVIVKAGLLWGSIFFIIALLLTIFLLFLYSEVAYYTEGRHRFTGYVELILGRNFKKIAFLITIAAYYGTLLVYGMLGGAFLSNFFGGANSFLLSMLFFAVGAALLFLRLGGVASINFYLTIPLFGFIVYLFVSTLGLIDVSKFTLLTENMFTRSDWFLPYGVWLFSLGGFAAIPITRDFFRGSSLKSFKRVILTSVLVSALFYCLFIFVIIGVSGAGTSADAFLGTVNVLGSNIILAGSVMGVLAVFTSFLALGVDLRGIYRYDFGISKTLASFFVVVPPVLLYLVGVQDLTRLLGLIGTIGLGFTGAVIILMARKLRKTGVISRKLKYSALLEWGVVGAILVAVIYEVWGLIG